MMNTEQSGMVSSDFRKALLKGEPKVLGAIQLVIVFIHIALGTIFIRWDVYVNYTTYTSFYGINLWGIPFFLISGSLSVAVERNPNASSSLVKAFVAMNIISAIESLGSFCIFCYDIYRCEYNGVIFFTEILVFLCLTNILQFSISVSLATFGQRALAVKSSPGQQAPQGVFMVNNPYTYAQGGSTAPQPYGNSNPYLQSQNASQLEVNRFHPTQNEQLGYPMMGQSGLRRNPTLSQQDYQTGNECRTCARNPNSNMPYN